MTETVTPPTEGWTWLHNANKWHYFVDNRSLCRKWGIFGSDELEQGKDDSPDNCTECRRQLTKHKAKGAEKKE